MRLDRARLDDRTLRVVVAVALVGLLARVAFLGVRVSHFDEARVAFWTLRYAETGEIHYRYGIHGPFVRYAARWAFAPFGATDFAARLPVALVGGLLPLVALWLRHRLSDVEVVALAVLLAVNPLLLYYSRFMRSSLLVAAFCVAAFAAFLRAYDGFGWGYLHAGAVLLGLGVASKENAVVYVLCWLGAGALLLDTALFRPRGHECGRARAVAYAAHLRERYEADPEAARRRAGLLAGHLVVAAALLGLVFFFFYAPRGGEAGLWSGNLGLTFDRTVEDLRTGFEFWFGHGEEKTVSEYRDTLERFVGTTLAYAGPLFLLSIGGFLLDRYGRAGGRPLVAFFSYWGFASVLGYPLGTDIWGAWIIVNALVPLAVPAAVALGALVDVGRDALSDDDRFSAGIVAVVLLVVAGQVAVVAAVGVYAEPTGPDNEMVQFAQPQQEMRPAIDATVATAAAHDGGPDALFYGGDAFVDMREGDVHTPSCIDWFNTLPWGWYLEAEDVSVTCARSPGGLPADPPPVVVVEADCTLAHPVQCRERTEALRAVDDVGSRLPDSYERYGSLHRTTGGNDFAGMVVFVDEEVRSDG
jgi:uncharacterized protein (TIGR03663 family)